MKMNHFEKEIELILSIFLEKEENYLKMFEENEDKMF
jgi:hypothetical protein